MTTITVEYDCGMTIQKASTLKSDSLLLANAPLGDTLIMQADQEHDSACEVCE